MDEPRSKGGSPTVWWQVLLPPENSSSYTNRILGFLM
jgi:hypothetical protein